MGKLDFSGIGGSSGEKPVAGPINFSNVGGSSGAIAPLDFGEISQQAESREMLSRIGQFLSKQKTSRDAALAQIQQAGGNTESFVGNPVYEAIGRAGKAAAQKATDLSGFAAEAAGKYLPKPLAYAADVPLALIDTAASAMLPQDADSAAGMALGNVKGNPAAEAEAAKRQLVQDTAWQELDNPAFMRPCAKQGQLMQGLEAKHADIAKRTDASVRAAQVES